MWLTSPARARRRSRRGLVIPAIDFSLPGIRGQVRRPRARLLPSKQGIGLSVHGSRPSVRPRGGGRSVLYRPSRAVTFPRAAAACEGCCSPGPLAWPSVLLGLPVERPWPGWCGCVRRAFRSRHRRGPSWKPLPVSSRVSLPRLVSIATCAPSGCGVYAGTLLLSPGLPPRSLCRRASGALGGACCKPRSYYPDCSVRRPRRAPWPWRSCWGLERLAASRTRARAGFLACRC